MMFLILQNMNGYAFFVLYKSFYNTGILVFFIFIGIGWSQ